MAKLNKKQQATVEENAGDSGFAPIPAGVVHAILRDVDTTKSGAKGPYWSWEFEIIDDREFPIDETGKKTANMKGRRLWNNTSLSDKAAFKMAETYDAFEAPLDTDTDDLIGKPVKLVISQRVIQEGNRKGETANQIDRLKVADAGVVEEFDKAKEARKAVEEIF